MEGGNNLMSNIDNRIVNMKFDNKQFESGVSETMKSLSGLKKGLDLSESAKSLSLLDKAGKTFNMSGLGTAVDNVASRLSNMGIVGMTALMNITNSAINTGKRIVSAFTIDPVKTGLSEYETQINAIQTIMANTSSKGTTLDEVNAALGELNKYADKTIYNFTEMTRNIGTFTAAGVDLDTSVSAIQGIANLAAISGSNSQQASMAMYQMSQALSSGTVKLMDWNSMVNAGIGGQIFQDALKETARAHGIAVDALIEKNGSFRESLSEGWITTEIATETLQKFTASTEDLTDAQIKQLKESYKAKGYTDEQVDSIIKLGNMSTNAATKVKTLSQLMDTLKETAQSGWTQSWELVIGDFEEAKELYTGISNALGAIIESGSAARNAMLLEWKSLGGRTLLIESLGQAFKNLSDIVKPIKEAFREIFPATTGKQLYDLTVKLSEFVKATTPSTEVLDKLKRTFKGVFAVVDIGVMAIKAISGEIGKFVKRLLPATSGILDITAGIGDFLLGIRDTIKETGFFNVKLEQLKKKLEPVSKFISDIVTRIKDMSAAFLGFKGDEKFLKLSDIFDKIGQTVSKVKDKLVEMFSVIKPVDLGHALNLGLIGGILLSVKKVVDYIKDLLGEGGISGIFEGLKGSLDGVVGILDGVKDSLAAWQSQLKAKALLAIAGAIGILAGSLLVISTIDSNKLMGAVAAIGALFATLVSTTAAMDKVGGKKGVKSFTTTAVALIAFSTAVAILAGAVKKIGDMEPENLAQGIISIGILMAAMVKTADSLSSNENKIKKGALSMIAFSVAINILASAVEKMSLMDPESMVKGLAGVGIVMTELSLFLNNTKMDGMGMFKATGIVILASSLLVMAEAVEKFAELSPGQLVKGLGAVGVALTELGVFIRIAGDPKRMISTAAGVAILSGALLIMHKAVLAFSEMPLDKLGIGLGAVAASLAIMVASMKLLPKDTMSKSLGMVALAGALVILGKALAQMGGMTWEEVARGLVTLAGSLGIIATAMNVMKGTAGASASMLIMTAALALFVPVLKSLGETDIATLVTGLLALAAVFVVIGGAAIILGPLTPVLLGLAAALALFGVSVLAVGAGVLALSVGLLSLGSAGSVAMEAFGLLLQTIIEKIPEFIASIGEGLVQFATVIGDNAPVIAEAAGKVLQSIIDTLTEYIPKVIDMVLQLLTDILNKLEEAVPEMVDSGMKLILGILEGISNNIQKVVQAGIDIVVKFLNGVASKLGEIIDAAFKVIIEFINGLADAIRENDEAIYDAVANLIGAILEAIGTFFKKTFEKGGELVGKFLGGVGSLGTKVWDAGKGIANSVINGAKSLAGGFWETGKNLVGGFINGVGSLAGSLWNAATNVASTAINAIQKRLDSHSPSRVGEWLGGTLPQGVAVGMTSMIGGVVKAGKNVADKAIEQFKGLDSTISDIMSNIGVDTNPVIRPVLDLDALKKRAKDISSFIKTPVLTPSLVMAGNVSAMQTKQASTSESHAIKTQGSISETKVSFEGSTFVIREEADIKKISTELAVEIERQRRR